jgi:hypothetical protein
MGALTMGDINWGDAAKGAATGAAAGAALGPWGIAGGALLGGVGSIAGGLLSDASDPEEIYRNLSIPDIQTLIAAGQLDPSAFDQIREDPAARAAQMEALGYMQNLGREGGMDLQAKVAHEQAIQRANQNDQSNRMAVLNNMAMRGMRGSGSELAATLSGQQSSAQANAMAGASAAAQARQRALQAMMGAGQMGGQVRGQDYQVASDRAAARDRIAQFNAQNRRSAYEQNTGWQMQKAGAQAGAAQQSYQRDVNTGGAIGSVAGGAAGAGMDYNALAKKQAEDERRKAERGW